MITPGPESARKAELCLLLDGAERFLGLAAYAI